MDKDIYPICEEARLETLARHGCIPMAPPFSEEELEIARRFDATKELAKALRMRNEMTEIQRMYAQLIKDIKAYDYWQELFAKYRVPEDATDNDIVNACNEFWMRLPDASCIRRQPFFLLCDICTEEAND